MAFDTIISGNIGSGQIGSVHMADGALGSGNIGSGSVSQFALASGTVNSGHVASGAIQGAIGATKHIASGTVGGFDLGSGAITAGTVGSGAVQGSLGALPNLASGTIGPNDHGSGSVLSGSIASGQVGQFAISSGAITSGRIGVGAGTPDGTQFLRDDFTWAAPTATVGSGGIGSGKIASGAVQGFFGSTPNIASGTVGSFDLGSGAVMAGSIGSGAVRSGNVASGAVGPGTISSGAVSSGKLNTNVVFAININSGQVLSTKLASGSALSGHIASGAILGAIASGARNIASGSVGGFDVASGGIGSGQLAVGGSPDGTKFLRDDFTWAAAGAGLTSGAVGSGFIASGAVQGFFGATRHIASGTLGVFDLGSGAVVAGTVGSGAIVSGNIASGQVGGNAVAAIANLTDNGFLVTNGIISPTDTGTVDDWSPAGIANATHIRCVNSLGSLTINGIVGGVDGRILTISAMSSHSVSLVNNALTSTAANRISTNDTDTISLPALTGGATSGNTIILIYDGTISRWRVLAINSSYYAPPSTFANHLLAQAGLAWSGQVTPATISGTVNNYAPGGDLFAAIIRQDLTAAATITGMSMAQATYAGKIVALHNISTSFSITITNEDAGSTAANRFTLANAASLVIPPGGAVFLRYDTTSSRWRPVSDSTVLASGQVLAGTIGSGAVVSGNIASGQVGNLHISSGAITSGRLGVTGVPDGTKVLRDDFTWAAPGTPTINSGDIGSGKIASGAVQGFFGVTRHIASGTVGSFDLGSGAILSGAVASGQIGVFHVASGQIYGAALFGVPSHLASGTVASINISPGAVGTLQLASGAVVSGKLGTTGAPDGTKFLRDDFVWAAPTVALASGAVSSGEVASGAIQGFFGATQHIASGTVGSFDLGSGAVVAGTVGSGAVLSGNIGSGQIGASHIASGAVGSGKVASGVITTYARNLIQDRYLTAEIISGVRCVQLNLTASGSVRIAMAAVSGRMPAIGVAFGNALSGQAITVVRYGEVLGPASEIGSGLCISGRPGGRSLWVGASGQVVTLSGGGPTIGVGATNSGAFGQKIGLSTSSGAVLIDSYVPNLLSGAAVITTNSLCWPA